MSGRRVVDPRPAPPAGSGGRAARPTTLDGAVVALVDNGKPHAGRLLELVVAELRRRWDIPGVVQLGPPSPGYGGRPEDAALATRWATVGIAAVGDCGTCTTGTALDAVILERLGVPTVPLVTRPFAATARALTALHGYADLPVVAVDHPITSLDPTGLAARAEQAAPLVAEALLGRPSP